MNELFGIPLDTLLAILGIGLGIAAGVVALLALRNPVLVRLGRYEEAEAPLREAYARLQETKQSTHARMRWAVWGLAEVCAHLGRPDEAAKWRSELARLEATTQPTTQPATRAAHMTTGS